MSEITNNDDARIKAFMASIESMLTSMEQIAGNYRPPLNGDRFMTDNELSKQLHISRRTLQAYRDNGKLPYYHFGGKILYREDDIETTLNENRRESFY